MKQIDTRGLSCPEPVIRARRAVNEIGSGEQAEILVESGAACENVLRAVRSLACEANAIENEGDFRIHITKQ